MNDNLYSFKVNIATVEDAPDIAKVTHEAFLRYKEMAGLDDVDALHETIEDANLALIVPGNIFILQHKSKVSVGTFHSVSPYA